MGAPGVPQAESSVGYGAVTRLEGWTRWRRGAAVLTVRMPLARVGRLMLHGGQWNERRLLDGAVVAQAIKHSGLPGHSGLGGGQRGRGCKRLWTRA